MISIDEGPPAAGGRPPVAGGNRRRRRAANRRQAATAAIPPPLPRYVLYEAALQRMYESATSELNEGLAGMHAALAEGPSAFNPPLRSRSSSFTYTPQEAAEMGRLQYRAERRLLRVFQPQDREDLAFTDASNPDEEEENDSDVARLHFRNPSRRGRVSAFLPLFLRWRLDEQVAPSSDYLIVPPQYQWPNNVYTYHFYCCEDVGWTPDRQRVRRCEFIATPTEPGLQGLHPSFVRTCWLTPHRFYLHVGDCEYSQHALGHATHDCCDDYLLLHPPNIVQSTFLEGCRWPPPGCPRRVYPYPDPDRVEDDDLVTRTCPYQHPFE